MCYLGREEPNQSCTFCRGIVLGEAGDSETIVQAHIGMSSECCQTQVVFMVNLRPDPKPFDDARAGIPVTTQRRFDVYSDVSKDQ